MTLIEFLSPLKKGTHKDRVLAVLYFAHRYMDAGSLTVEEIRQTLHRARVQGWKRLNIADILAKSGHYVDSPGSAGNRMLWRLTESGAGYVRDLLGLPATEPEIEHEAGGLADLASKIQDPEVRGYVEEAIKCLQVDALRASVVFVWSGAMRVLQQEMLTQVPATVTAALQKHDPKARKVSTVDHFAYIKDRTVLLGALELGVLDKSEKDTLQEALDLRNRCGHPGKYKPGAKKVSSFIEDVVSILF